MYSLIFFVSSPLVQCQQANKADVALRWQDRRATGLMIPARFIKDISTDSLDKLLAVRLDKHETAMAGQYQPVDGGILFEPVVPFTRGLRYAVWLRNERLKEFDIPVLDGTDKPVLKAIYPTQDSLPENLLKVYLHFSRSMREGQALRYITVLKNGSDTLNGVFLDLQPELWNADRTVLTLWLDPGRIKRNLQPNRKLGKPLMAGTRYAIVISGEWPDQQGATLGKSTTKSFVSSQRDSLSPVPANWTMYPPESGSPKPLSVAFGEALDHSLLSETLTVMTDKGAVVPGKWQVGQKEKQVLFTPADPWKPGTYTLQIEGRLEDLAGNNLNRPFDRDITRKQAVVTPKPFVDRAFVVQ